MNHDKLKEYSMVSAIITSSLEGLFKAQELLVDLMCRECDIPVEMKKHMIDDMNKVIGVQKL
jgi:hypothetical protein